jgi:hypothetical protein
MGSRRTHDDRMKRLREAGVEEEALNRLASPIGLDLGARTPEETAISIAAEIIVGRWGGSGTRLTDTVGRIHHDGGGSSRIGGAPPVSRPRDADTGSTVAGSIRLNMADSPKSQTRP